MATDDFFRARLDQMIDLRHPLVVLAGRLPWSQIEAALAPAFARWSENVVWQYFSDQDYYTPSLPCDATQIGRFRTAIGEAGVEELLKATIDTAVQTQATGSAEFERPSVLALS
ncbi:hypothetical protein MASR2M16_16700 [Thauera terpenica]|jgi:hypothetical protein